MTFWDRLKILVLALMLILIGTIAVYGFFADMDRRRTEVLTVESRIEDAKARKEELERMLATSVGTQEKTRKMVYEAWKFHRNNEAILIKKVDSLQLELTAMRKEFSALRKELKREK